MNFFRNLFHKNAEDLFISALAVEQINQKKYIKLLLKAAKYGHAEASFKLGYIYYKGIGVKQCNDNAFRYFFQSAKSNNTDACCYLFLMCLRGEVLTQNLEEVLKLIENAKELKKAEDEINTRQNNIQIEKGLPKNLKQNIAPEFIPDYTFMGVDTKLAEPFVISFNSSNVSSPKNIQKTASTEKKLVAPIINKETFNHLNGSNENRHFELLESKDDNVSTTQLGKIIGIEAKPFLFEKLQKDGYIKKIQSRYLLTELGKSEKTGGHYRQTDDGSSYVVWPIKFSSSFMPLKQEFLNCLDFCLFHMTHLNNLQSIMDNGLLSHNSAPDYLDISNVNVNNRRKRIDPIHKRPLHEYVPMYFNPRNAMLYEKQKEFGNQIVIIEVDCRICLSNYTIFSERNAAAEKARFVCYLNDVKKFDWTKINSPRWKFENTIHHDIKQIMMSECLVLGNIAPTYFTTIHVMNSSIANKINVMLFKHNHININISNDLFF